MNTPKVGQRFLCSLPCLGAAFFGQSIAFKTLSFSAFKAKQLPGRGKGCFSLEHPSPSTLEKVAAAFPISQSMGKGGKRGFNYSAGWALRKVSCSLSQLGLVYLPLFS